MTKDLTLLTTESCGHCKTIKERFPDLECRTLSSKEDMAACKQFGISAVLVLLVRGDENITRAIVAIKYANKGAKNGN